MDILGKVIVIDGGNLMFRAILLKGGMLKRKAEGTLPQDTFIAPIKYTYFSIIISTLKRIGVNKEDTVIIALDARNSWRKAFYQKYKAQRKDARDKQEYVDWNKAFADIEEINNELKNSTDWYFLKFDNVLNLLDLLQTKQGEELIGEDYTDDMFEKDYGIEADDIQAVACKVFKDKEVILATGDKDLYQLAYFSNVKIWSFNLKKIKAGTGGYAMIPKPLKIISDKVRLGDISDNIIVDKIADTELEQKRRNFIIDLLDLPEWIEEPIKEVLLNLPKKEIIKDKLPFQNSLAGRFWEIYKEDKIVTYQYCEQLMAKREARKKEKRRRKYCEKVAKEWKERCENKKLIDLTEKEFKRLKELGLIWELFPDAPEFYEDLKTVEIK